MRMGSCVTSVRVILAPADEHHALLNRALHLCAPMAQNCSSLEHTQRRQGPVDSNEPNPFRLAGCSLRPRSPTSAPVAKSGNSVAFVPAATRHRTRHCRRRRFWSSCACEATPNEDEGRMRDAAADAADADDAAEAACPIGAPACTLAGGCTGKAFTFGICLGSGIRWRPRSCCPAERYRPRLANRAPACSRGSRAEP